MPTYVFVYEGVCQGPPGMVLAQPMPSTYPGYAEYVDVSALPAVPPMGSLYSAGMFSAPPAPAPPQAATPAQQAALLLAGGLTLQGATGADEVMNGTYACDNDTVINILGVEVGLLKNGTLPNGVATLAWPDLSGAPHLMTAPQLTQVFTYIQGFVAACREYASGNGSTLPATVVSIT